MNGPDDDNTSPDWVISGMSLLLRAERSGSGAGRIYTVTGRVRRYGRERFDLRRDR